jgi:glycosyltransferase involved in cell wall biosynthesis
MKPRISVVINTFNEEKNLAYALRSVRTWADEIIVVDMHSEDRTVTIAREHGANVFFFERMGFVEPARKFAVEQATGEWIFILDADEIVPEPLSVQLMQFAYKDIADVFTIPRLNYLLGVPILYTGWGPHQDGQIRFFKRDKLQFSSRIHAGINPASGVRMVTLPYSKEISIHHFCFLDVAHLFEKLNLYTSVEAQQAFERGMQVGIVLTILKAFHEFAIRYIRKQGYKDGWRGFYLSGFMAIYRFVTYAKLQEIHSAGGRDKIIDKYHGIAEEVISGYGQTDRI